MEKSNLVGMWFVSREDNKKKWQGQIIDQVDKSSYLVQLYSWMTGSPTCCKLVHADEIYFQEWDLYKTHDDFKNKE
jgi:hypothetical protein